MTDSAIASAAYTIEAAPSNSSISPSNAGFYRTGINDIAVTMTLNGNSLTSIVNGTSTLVQGTNYTVSGSAIAIKASYLNTLPEGNATLTFNFSGGSSQTLVIAINPAIISPTTLQYDVNNTATANVTLQSGETLSCIKVWQTPLNSWDYTVSGNVANVSSYFNYVFGKWPDGTCTLTFITVSGKTAVLTATKAAANNSTVSPQAITFDKGMPGDIPVTMALNGNTLSSIMNGSSVLTQGTDYTVSGSAVTLKSSYLKTLSAGNSTLTFKFSAGSSQNVTVTVLESVITPNVIQYDMNDRTTANVTLQSGETLSCIKVWQTPLNSWDYTVSGNVVNVSNYFNYAFGKWPDGTCTLTFITVSGKTAVLTATKAAANNSTVSPQAITFDKGMPGDIAVTMTLNGNTLSSITNGSSVLTRGTNYTVSGSAVTLKSSYLKTLSAGDSTLTFNFSAGSSQNVTVTVLESVITPNVIQYDMNNRTTANVTLQSGETLSCIKVWQTPLNSWDYTVSGNVVNVSNYFNYAFGKWPDGTCTLTFEMASGRKAILTATKKADTQPPTPPSNLQCTSKTGSTVSLSWSAATDNIAVARYEVYKNADTVPVITTAALNCIVTNLSPNTSYTFTVKAKDASGNTSQGSNSVSIITNSDTSIYSKAAFGAAVQELGSSNTGICSTEFDLTPLGNNINGFVGYTDSSSNITDNSSFAMLLRMNSSGKFDVMNGTDFAYLTEVPYTSGTKYHVRIAMDFNAKNYSVWITPNGGSELQLASCYAFKSNALPIDDLGKVGLWSQTDNQFKIESHNVVSGYNQTSDTQPPTPPGNLTCTSKTSSSVSLTWTGSTDNTKVIGYEIYNSTTSVGITASTVFTVNGLTANTQYSLSVKSKDGAGNSSSSAIQVTTLLDTPVNLKSTLNSNIATITWDSVAGATGYEVYRDKVKVGTVVDASYVDSSLSANTSYIYTVVAINSSGNTSLQSTPLRVSTSPTNYISKDITLDGDANYDGDVVLSANLNLNGHKVTVNGNLIQTNGVLNVSGGAISIAGDYSITGGYLDMRNTADYVKVGGSFSTSTCEKESDYLKYGTLEIKGDFTQKSSDATSGNNSQLNFCASGGHKVILSGDGRQTISFDSPSSSYFGILEIKKSNSELVLTNDVLNAHTLITNGYILPKIASIKFEWDLNADEVVNGDLVIINNINLRGHKLTVRGNVLQKGGWICLNGGTLDISGDYNITGGYLDMRSATDYVKVGGSFSTSTYENESDYLKYGTLEVKGDFTQKSSDATSGNNSQLNFCASGGHKVILSGDGRQTISFDSPSSSYFGVLEIKKSNSELVLTNDVLNAHTLITNGYILPKIASIKFEWDLNADEVVNGDLIVINNINLRGHKLTVRGNVLQKGGWIHLDGGTLDISGDYNIIGGFLDMRNTTDYVKVGGSFSTSTCEHEYDRLEAGTLEIKGDFTQKSDSATSGNDSRLNFCILGSYKVILSGDGRQTISFDTPSSSYFGILEIKKSNSELIFTNDVLNARTLITNGYILPKITSIIFEWDLNADEVVNGDLIVINNINLRGHKLTVRGNVLQKGGWICLDGGTLDISGDYNITGGFLNMRNTADYLKVGGSFSTSTCEHGYDRLTAGTLEVKGDFTQKSDSATSGNDSRLNFCTSDSHKVILSGDGRQTISFDSPSYSYFNTLEIKKSNSELVLTNDVLNVHKLITNGYILPKIASIIFEWDLNADEVVNGDLTIDNNINLKGHRLTVRGNIRQTGGWIYPDEGTLDISGNYNITGGFLDMRNTTDYVKVGGSFSTSTCEHESDRLTAGTLEVKGDFTQKLNNATPGNDSWLNFCTSDSHKVILSGDGRQTVSFDSCGLDSNGNAAGPSCFNTLILTKSIDNYNFNITPCWKKLEYGIAPPSDITIPMHFGTGGPYAPTGNYSRSFTDMSAPAPGFNTAFTRTYNSRNDNAATSSFGRGWSFGYEGSIKPYSDSMQVVTLPDGSILTFNQNSNGSFTANDSRNTLVKNSDGTFTLSTKDLYVYTFNSSGYMTSMSDRYGNKVAMNVDSNGKVKSLTDSASRGYTIQYSSGHISTIIENNTQRKVIYGYDDYHRLNSVTDPAGNITTYTYDVSDYLSGIHNDRECIETIVYNHTSEDANSGKINKITDLYGNVKTYTYDNTMGRTTIVDQNGRKTVQWYDSQYSITTNQDAGGRSTTVQYETYGGAQNKYSEEKFVTDRNGNKTEYVRYDNGNIHYIINPDKSQKEFTYDGNNNITIEKDENGKYTFYVYDNNLLVKKAQPLKDGITQYDSSNDADYAITVYTYYQALNNSTGKLIKTVTDPEGNVTTYTYDGYGNLCTVNDPENPQNMVTYTYNGFGCKTEVKTPKGYTTTSTYDNDGRLEKQVISGGNETTRITYDGYGRKLQEVSPNLYDSTKDDIASHTYSGDHGYRYTYFDNGKVETVKDPENNLTSYTYDLYGNVDTQTNPNNSIYRYTYDALNRPVYKYFKDNASSPEVLLEEYIYTILSDGKTQKTVRRHLDDTNVADTVYTYDYAQRQVSRLNPDGKTISADYNGNGTVKSSTDATGGTTYFNYDLLNRVKQKWAPFDTNAYTYVSYDYYKNNLVKTESTGKDVVAKDGAPTNLVTKNYTYYKNGKPNIVSDSAGRQTQYFYDADGTKNKEIVNTDVNDSTKVQVTEYENNYLEKPMLKKVHVRAGDLSENSFNDDKDTTIITSYGYDKNGNLKAVISPIMVVTTYDYDNMNRQTKVSQSGKDENNKDVTISTSTTYNWEGKPVKAIDANGNIINYDYNPRGLLSKEIRTVTIKGTPATLVNAYYYDRGGRKIAEVSSGNYDETKDISQMNRTVYEYDGMDRVKKKSYIGKTKTFDPVANKWNDKDDSIILEAYSYDGNGNILMKQDAMGVKGGYGTEYTYNFQNKAKTVLDPETKSRGLAFTTQYTYDGLGRKTGETNAKNVTIVYNYDDAGNVISQVLKKTADDGGTVFKSAEYDLLGNAVTQTEFNNAENNKNTTVYQYNAFGKVRKVVHPGDETIPSETVQYQYDAVGNLVSQVNDMGTAAITADDVVDIYAYDNQGRVLSHTQQKGDGAEAIQTFTHYDKNGNKRFEMDGESHVKESTYDEDNHLITTKVDGKHLTTYGYDKNGNQVSVTDWRNNTSINVYDALGRLIEKDDANGKPVEKLEYNQNNLQVNSYDAYNHLTQHLYDRNNRLISTTDPVPGHVTSQTYDNVGNIETKTDGRANKTTYDYDEFNRLKSVLNAKNETTSYTYDLNGNMLMQTDGKGNATRFIYNAANKPKARMDNGVTQPTAGKSETYTYYSDGSLHTKVDRNGCTTTYAYDSHGRVTSTTAGAINIRYGYDRNGNQTTLTDGTGTTTRIYDELGRVTSKIVPNVGASGTLTINYQYDLIDGLEDGYTKETSTDQKNNVTTKVYDKTGRLKRVIADGKTTTYNYYDNGSRQSVVYNDNSMEYYTYYNDNLLSTLTNKRADGSILETYTYTYDAAHNMASKVDSKGTTSYTYDSLERLETVTEPGGRKTTYGYDTAGNRVTETIENGSNKKVTSYSYNDLNRLIGSTIALNDVMLESDVYNNDNNGNVLTVTVTAYSGGAALPSQVTENYYDSFNQLIKTQTSTTLVENVYNGEGLRVKKRVSKGTVDTVTKYIYEYDQVVQELDASGNQIARNVYGTNLLMRTVGGQSLYYMYNGHADVTALIDATTGSVVGTYYYDAFGNLTDTTGNANNNITYAGYQYDKETGLYYCNARMYDPKIARFLQEDTYTGDPNDSLSLNLYTYCHNEPLMYDDPTGHWPDFGGMLNGAKNAASWVGSKASSGASWVGSEVSSGASWVGSKVSSGASYVASGVSSAVSSINQRINDPIGYIKEENNIIYKPILKKMGVDKNSGIYKAAKYIGTRVEATDVVLLNIGKGMVNGAKLAIKTPADDLVYASIETGRGLDKLFNIKDGLGNDDVYAYCHNQAYESLQQDVNAWASIPGSINNDFKTVFNIDKAKDFLINPDMSLEDASQYEQSFVNSALIVVPAAKLANAGIVGLYDSAGALADRTGLQPSTVGGYDSNLSGWAGIRQGLSRSRAPIAAGLGGNVLEASGNKYSSGGNAIEGGLSKKAQQIVDEANSCGKVGGLSGKTASAEEVFDAAPEFCGGEGVKVKKVDGGMLYENADGTRTVRTGMKYGKSKTAGSVVYEANFEINDGKGNVISNYHVTIK